jgi:hypothetical protein
MEKEIKSLLSKKERPSCLATLSPFFLYLFLVHTFPLSFLGPSSRFSEQSWYFFKQQCGFCRCGMKTRTWLVGIWDDSVNSNSVHCVIEMDHPLLLLRACWMSRLPGRALAGQSFYPTRHSKEDYPSVMTSIYLSKGLNEWGRVP